MALLNLEVPSGLCPPCSVAAELWQAWNADQGIGWDLYSEAQTVK